MSQLGEELDFSNLETITIPVTVSDNRYMLVEASEAVAAEYRNRAMRGVTLVDGKVSGMPTNLANLQSFLVSRCLFAVDAEGNRNSKHIREDIVSAWPSRIVKVLFEKAKSISELDEEETEESVMEQMDKLQNRLQQMREKEQVEKNGQSGMVAG